MASLNGLSLQLRLRIRAITAPRFKLSHLTAPPATLPESSLSPLASLRDDRRYARVDVLLLRQIYDEYDADGSGSMTFQELKNALEKQRTDKAILCLSCPRVRPFGRIDPFGTCNSPEAPNKKRTLFLTPLGQG